MKQKEMFAIVEAWRESGLTKQQFIKEQPISSHKLNYWIGRYNKLSQHSEQHHKSNFQEICLPETDQNRAQKTLELTTRTGAHIIIYD